ncbi:MAG: glycosyl hydrolase 115 family protein [Salinivirgaceae bacterium]|nr:glycosyl hydrolase 115 family protein [Salinivirgaceae bacterium]
MNYLSDAPTARLLLAMALVAALPLKSNSQIAFERSGSIDFRLNATQIVVDPSDFAGVQRVANIFADDINRVTGQKPEVANAVSAAPQAVIVGTIGKSPIIDKLVKSKKIDVKNVAGKWEASLIQIVDNPTKEIGRALVIAGADKRGTIYGMFHLSRLMGVSPWYFWADVPTEHHDSVFVTAAKTVLETPKVKYRGIFLNDEAPCLTTWVKNTYGTDYGDHHFYADVFELILRLRGNFMWPAMWGWAFYADDPENSRTADEFGIVMGTSHHEPMARNHQEWVRHRDEYGVWDYPSNKTVIDKFFREGIERSKDNEDLVTIGMRGDGDTAMGGKEGHDDEYVSDDEKNKRLLEDIIDNQRKIIADVTGRPANQRQQVWALYKEVQKYYDLGLRVPDDVIILLSDDNWGDVRKLPTAAERNRKGGWGIYYHVDYVGAPRNSKWLNITPVQNMWEQLQLTYAYGVDKLWVLNVGDLKPMEYPITLFLDMAQNPENFNAENLLNHTLKFCAEQFGDNQAVEAARILNLYSKYNGRTTAEMMDHRTYDLASGEFKQVTDEYLKLEAEALRQYISLPDEYRDAYKQLILFPVQAMANIYEMYYAQAMNLDLYKRGDAAANQWADKVEACFARDAALHHDFNKVMANGKWDGMMIQKHIGYTNWNDNFPADRLPRVQRIEKPTIGGFSFKADKRGYTAIEAEHYFEAKKNTQASWTTINYMGRTLSGVALMPYTAATDGAALTYKVELPAGVSKVKVHVVVKSTLAFNGTGHHYHVGFEGGNTETVFFNEFLNEDPKNIYSIYYPTVSRRVAENTVELSAAEGWNTLTIKPMDPGIVFEKIVVDYGGYTQQFLFGTESGYERK